MKKGFTFLCAFLCAVCGYSQSFQPGNLVVVRSGDNVNAAVAGTYSTIYLDEYSAAGVLVNSHAITGLAGDGGSTNEGYYQLSPNGMYLAIGGYAKAVGTSRTIATDGTGDLAKVQIYGSSGVGTPLTTYTLPAGVFSYGNPATPGQVTNSRLTGTVALNDGSGLYAGGGSTTTANGGVFYINSGGVFNQVQSTQSNLRVPGIFSGQLFTSGNAAALGDAAAIRLGIFNTALPTTASAATVTNLQGADFSIPIASGGVPINICQYVLYDADATVSGPDVLFVTDDGSTGGNKGGIKKYAKDASGNWNLKYQINTGTGVNDVNNYKFRGLVGQSNSAGNVTFYATALDPVNNVYKVLTFNDTNIFGSATAPVYSTLITAPSSNYIFKGISFTPGSTLPLKLTSFEVRKQLNSIDLGWSTEQELNTSKFEIERSLDGTSFELRKTINSKNTLEKHTYTFTDEADFSGTAYYRLKMIDLDGTFTYSDVKAVKNSNEDQLVVYPNPTTTHLNVKHEKIAGKGKMEIIQTDGKIVFSNIPEVGTIETVLSISSLPKGVYILKTEINEKTISKSFIKE